MGFFCNFFFFFFFFFSVTRSNEVKFIIDKKNFYIMCIVEKIWGKIYFLFGKFVNMEIRNNLWEFLFLIFIFF